MYGGAFVLNVMCSIADFYICYFFIMYIRNNVYKQQQYALLYTLFLLVWILRVYLSTPNAFVSVRVHNAICSIRGERRWKHSPWEHTRWKHKRSVSK